MAEFIERADEINRIDHAAGTVHITNPITQQDPVPGVMVEEASIQENLGEFPGGSSVADQGEWRETPMTRDELRQGGDPQPDHGDAP